MGVLELASLGLGQGREMVWYWVNRPAMAIAGTTTTHENWTTLQFSFVQITEKDSIPSSKVGTRFFIKLQKC